MKKLLFVLLASVSAFAGRAQSHSHSDGLKPGEPWMADQLLAVKPSTAARPAGVVRLPGRTTNYARNAAANQWSSAPEVVRTTYNAAGQVTLEVTTDSATSRLLSRSTYAYTAANNISTLLLEVWNGSAWQNQRREEFTYNTLNTYTGWLSQQWVAGAWQNQSRNTIVRDSRNNAISYLGQDWMNNAWVSRYGGQMQHTYNATNQISETIASDLNPTTGTFLPPTKSFYSYLSPTSELITEVVNQTLQNGVYVNSSRSLNTYNAQQRLGGYEDQIWTGTAWAPSFRTTYTYSGSTRSQVKLNEYYQTGAWVNNFRITDSFDVYGNPIGFSFEDWRNGAWLLRDASRYSLHYDADNNVTRRVLQLYNNATTTFNYVSLSTYADYQAIVLGTKIDATLAARIALYPNPATGTVTLTIADLPGTEPLQAELRNSLGQIVQTHLLQPRQGQLRYELHLEQLPVGVYLLQVQTTAGTIFKRVVRQ